LLAAGVGDHPISGVNIPTKAPTTLLMEKSTRVAATVGGVPGNGDTPAPSGSSGAGTFGRSDSSRSVTGSQFLVESILTDLDDDLFFSF